MWNDSLQIITVPQIALITELGYESDMVGMNMKQNEVTVYWAYSGMYRKSAQLDPAKFDRVSALVIWESLFTPKWVINWYEWLVPYLRTLLNLPNIPVIAYDARNKAPKIPVNHWNGIVTVNSYNQLNDALVLLGK